MQVERLGSYLRVQARCVGGLDYYNSKGNGEKGIEMEWTYLSMG